MSSSKSSSHIRYYINPYINNSHNNDNSSYDKGFCTLDYDKRCEYLLPFINNVINQIIQQYPIPINKSNSNIDYSLYEGYGGIGYMFYHLSLREEYINVLLSNTSKSTSTASSSKLFNNNKIKYLRQSELYINSAIELMYNSSHHKSSITFICGSSGLYSLAAIIQYKQNNINKCKSYLLDLIKLKSDNDNDNDTPDELFYGRTGLLYSILFVRKHLKQNGDNNTKNDDNNVNKDSEFVDITHQLDSIAILLINEIVYSGIGFQHSQSPLMWSWHETNYFGAAHGIIGIIHILLFAIDLFHKTEFGYDKLMTLITGTVDYLLTKRFDSGNFPSSEHSESDKYIQFCHGSGGFVIPLLKLYEITKNKIYHEAALKAAECIWERGLLIKGVGLCHGLSGNGYSFLQLHYFNLSQTKEEKSTVKSISIDTSSTISINSNSSIIESNERSKTLDRAWLFTRYSIEGNLNDKSITSKLWSKPDEPYSLFNGLAGAICFWLDLIAATKKSEQPIFPGFTI